MKMLTVIHTEQNQNMDLTEKEIKDVKKVARFISFD